MGLPGPPGPTGPAGITGPMGATGVTGPPGPPTLFLYARARFVDPVNGDDGNEGASVDAPKQTITSALSSITDNSAENRYTIILFPGGTVDPGAIFWKPFVSLQGWGQNVSTVSQDLQYLGASEEIAVSDFNGLLFFGTLSFNLTEATETQIHITDSRITSLVWAGGGPFPGFPLHEPTSEAGNRDEGPDPFGSRLFLHSSTLDLLTISSGGVFAGDTSFQIVEIQDGDSAFLEAVGGALRGEVVMNGRAQLFTRGVANTASFSGAPTIVDTPVWETDSSSMIVRALLPGSPLAPTLTGTIAIRQEDVVPVTITAAQSPFTVNLETYIRVDATLGSVTVILPLATRRVTREIIVKKLDPGANTVTVATQGIDVIDGASSVFLTIRGAFIGVISHSLVVGGEWDIIRRGI